MKFFLALILWIILAAVLAAGCVMAVKGSFWLLGLGLLVFIGMFVKLGCLSHD